MSQQSINSEFIIQNALLAAKLAKKMGNSLSIHGVSLTEYLVMHYLDSAPHKAVSRIDLADHVGMSASGITRLLAPMEKNGLVEKEANPRDARQSLVRLSKVGQRVLQEARVSFSHIADGLTANLSQNQLAKMVELGARLI